MSDFFSNDKTPILTSEQVERWKVDYTKLLEARRHLDTEIGAAEKRLAAVATIMGISLAELMGESGGVDQEDDGDPANLTAAIKTVLKNASTPMTRVQIRDALMLFESFRDRLQRNPNVFYNAMTRLIKRGDIREINGRFVSPEMNEAPTG